MFDTGFLPSNNLSDLEDSVDLYATEFSTVHQVHYIINIYIDGLLIIMGILGNAAAIFIFSQDKSQTSNGVYLQGLAVHDSVFLAVMFFYTTLRSVYLATGNLDDYYRVSPYIIAITVPIGWIAQTGTIWFTLAAAVDRYLAISKPFKAVQLCTRSNAVRGSVLVSAAAIFFNLPRFAHYFQVAAHTAGGNSTFVSHVKYNMSGWDSDAYHYVYHVTLTYVLIYALPLAALIYCNLRLIHALRASQRLRAQHTRRASADTMLKVNFHVTLNVVVLITKFAVCTTPDFVGGVLGSIGVPLDDDFLVFATVAQMLLVLNSAANFYIYCVFNSKFRKALGEYKAKLCCHQSSLDGKPATKVPMHTFKATLTVGGSVGGDKAGVGGSVADLTPATSVSLLAVNPRPGR